ncbi:hypothetical protein BG000_007752 [Podila horticola]|nr:hypothetical protein BG000_007752 [Podila horticola]
MARLTRLLALALSAVLSLQAVIAAPRPELVLGTYKILSVAAKENPQTGVDPSRPSSLPIRVNAALDLWEVKPQPEPGVYRLSLIDAFPYTGIVDRTVVATFDEQVDQNWYVRYHATYDAYTIESAPLWPTPAWTLENDDPNATVTIRLFELMPAKSQLWTFERVNT